MPEKMYDADIYLRLSKEDGDKEESDSIANQRELVLDYISRMPDIRVHKIKIDDGFSGVNFNRPAFNEMLEDIKSGAANCIIVKDFSRFGRNYIEAGKYIQVMFPRTGVRFIAINDSYDSLKVQNGTENILVPFKNMVNDAYSGDISVKVRSQLDIKRKRGDFIGSFAVFGYCKDPEAKNKLIVDGYAADVVKDIFRWKLEGMSQGGIADRLNNNGILSPMEYKRALGMRFTTTFKVNPKAKWSPVAVGRILKNEIYTGVLEQGKRVTPNYKVQRRVELPKQEWIRVENTHEAIIEREQFDTVQRLLALDTRVPIGEATVHPFSGIIVCGDCGYAMIRKYVTKGSKRYYYFICSKNKANRDACTTHSTNAEACEAAVLYALQAHIAVILNMERAMDVLDSLPYQQAEVRKLEAQIQKKREEIQKCQELRLALYEDYKAGILTQADYQQFKASYDMKIKEAERGIASQETEIERLAAGESGGSAWIQKFLQYRNITQLDRKTVAELIETITVYEGNRIEVKFRYEDEFSRLITLMNYGKAV